MPYVRCSRCGRECYSAAAWTTRDECPNCLAPLVPDRRRGSLRALNGFRDRLQAEPVAPRRPDGAQERR